MRTLIVKPAPGHKVRRPEAGYDPVPAEGCRVVLTPYYQRCLDRGALIEATPAAPAAEGEQTPETDVAPAGDVRKLKPQPKEAK